MAVWRSLSVTLLVLAAVPAVHAQTYTLVEKPAVGDCTKVTIDLKLTGEIRSRRDTRIVPVPLTAQAHHAFVQRVMEIGPSGLPEKVARVYETAKSTVTVANSKTERSLRDDRRLVVAQRPEGQFLCYSPNGSFTRDDLELTSEHFDTLALAGLLPGKDVAVGDTWKPSNAVVQAVCLFEGLVSQDLTGKLDEVADGTARFSLTGSATGIEAGAMVKLTINAQGRYDLLKARLTELNWTQKDERDQGPATPAVVVEAVTTLKREVIDEPRELSKVGLESVPTGFEPPPEMTTIKHTDPKGRFELIAARDWKLVGQTVDQSVLRLIDRGDFVAQATVTPWKKADPGKHLTPTEFRQAVEETPGWQTEAVIQEGEVIADGGRWVYRVSLRGTLDDVTVVQTCYLVAAPDGSQAVVAFTMKAAQAAKVGSRDLDLVNGLDLSKK